MTVYTRRVSAIENTGSNKTDVETFVDAIDGTLTGSASISVGDDPNGGPGDLLVSGYDPDIPGGFSFGLPVGSVLVWEPVEYWLPSVRTAGEFADLYVEVP